MSHLGHVVIVEWDDAWWDDDETRPSEWKESCPTITIGWCVRDTPKTLSVAHERHDEDQTYKGVTHVPKAYIRKVRRLPE